MKTKTVEIGLMPIITLVVWTGFVAVGVLGQNVLLRTTASRPTKAPPADVQLIDVAISSLPIVRSDISSAIAAPPDMPAEPQPPQPPAIETPPALPAAPPLVDLSPPPTLIGLLPRPNEFSKPTSKPVAVATTAAAVPPMRTGAQAAPNAPSIQHMIYGQGAAVQPAPEYPPECVMARQEGTVVVRFHIDQLGRVSNVQVETPSRWPLLNQAAARSVRQTWSFPPGTPGDFDVSIEYKLTQEQ
jgi:TonB family protein